MTFSEIQIKMKLPSFGECFWQRRLQNGILILSASMYYIVAVVAVIVL